MAKPAVAASRVQQPPASRQAVAVQPKGGAMAIHEQVPDFMKPMRGQGTENIGQNDIETPRIKLLQAVSDEITNFDNAKPGEFWHSIAEVSMGSEVRIVPLYTDMRAILWRPRHQGGGILARADDGIHWSPAEASFTVQPYKDQPKHLVQWKTTPLVSNSRLLEWGSSDPSNSESQPAATRMYNMAVALPDHPELGIGVITLQRSGIKVARKFMGKLKLMSAPSFGCYFTMGQVLDQNDQGDKFFNYSFTAAGFVQDHDEFNTYHELYEQFKRLGLNIKDLEGAQDEGLVQGSATETDPNAPKY